MHEDVRSPETSGGSSDESSDSSDWTSSSSGTGDSYGSDSDDTASSGSDKDDNAGRDSDKDATAGRDSYNTAGRGSDDTAAASTATAGAASLVGSQPQSQSREGSVISLAGSKRGRGESMLSPTFPADVQEVRCYSGWLGHSEAGGEEKGHQREVRKKNMDIPPPPLMTST